MSYWSANVKCPYYAHDNVKECTITCEGVLPGTTMKSHFAGRSALDRQMKKRCTEDYESCPWFKVVTQKYE